MSMTIDTSAVLRYLKVAEDAKVGEDARLSVAEGLQEREIRHVETGYASRLGERVFRNDSDREAYREVRRDFLDCLKALYGVKKDSDLPPMVLAAFQKGEGVTGRPLTKRRITFVLDAVRRDLGFASMKVFSNAAGEAATAKADGGGSVDDSGADDLDCSNADEGFDELPKGLEVGIAPSKREKGDEAKEEFNRFRVNISGVVRGQEADDLETCFLALQKACATDDNDLISAGNNSDNAPQRPGVKKWLRDVCESLSMDVKKGHIDAFEDFVDSDGHLEEFAPRLDLEYDEEILPEDMEEKLKDRRKRMETVKEKTRYTFKQALEILKCLTKNGLPDLDQVEIDDKLADSEIRFSKVALLSTNDSVLVGIVKRDDETIKQRIRSYLDNHEKDIPELLRENVEETVSEMMDRLDALKDYFSHERCVLLDAEDDKEGCDAVCRELIGDLINHMSENANWQTRKHTRI